jgi:GDP-L-fucose synthase
MKAATGFAGEIAWDASKPDGQIDKIFDVTRLQALGLSCPTTLHEGLRTTVTWFLDARRKGAVRL